MNPTVSWVTKVEVVTEDAAVAGVAATDGAALVETMEEIALMDRWWWWRQEGQ